MKDTASSTPEFLKTLQASGLVSSEKIQALCTRLNTGSEPAAETLIETLLSEDLLTPWQINQLQKGKSKGFQIGKYTLRSLLGVGGMGYVYLAKHTTLGGLVAIKVLPKKRVRDGSYLERFKLEARAAAKLNHPNIARVIDLDATADNKIHFMVMEYIDGTDLRHKIKHEGILAGTDAVDFIRQAALGLHEAHEQGFVHRDIKPGNLMLDRFGSIKVLDLGLAKIQADDEDVGSVTMEFKEKTLGTADYIAPEQVTNSHTADRRADIYSLGCTLFFLLTGKAPFGEGSVKDRLRSQMNAKPPSPAKNRPELPGDLIEFYFRMMQKNPDARPQTAQEVASIFQSWIKKYESVTALTTPPRSPISKDAKTSSVIIQSGSLRQEKNVHSENNSSSKLTSDGSRIVLDDSHSRIDDSLQGGSVIGGSSIIRRRQGKAPPPQKFIRPPTAKTKLPSDKTPKAPPRELENAEASNMKSPTGDRMGHQSLVLWALLIAGALVVLAVVALLS
ncbi:MAG: serine/threonine-protein kinase [Pirellulales bacterium]